METAANQRRQQQQQRGRSPESGSRNYKRGLSSPAEFRRALSPGGAPRSHRYIYLQMKGRQSNSRNLSHTGKARCRRRPCTSCRTVTAAIGAAPGAPRLAWGCGGARAGWAPLGKYSEIKSKQRKVNKFTQPTSPSDLNARGRVLRREKTSVFDSRYPSLDGGGSSQPGHQSNLPR